MGEKKATGYEKTIDERDVVRYKLANKFVKGAEVSEDVKVSLDNLPLGSLVDEKGMEIKNDAQDQIDDAAENGAEENAEAGVPAPGVEGGDRLEPDAPTRPDERPGGPQEPGGSEEAADANDARREANKVDEEAPEDESAVREPNSPESPEELDEAKANELPEVKPTGKVEPPREDETPGGPQEPLTPQPPAIDSADDVDDESGLDVEEQDRAARQAAGDKADQAGMGFPRKNGKTVDIFNGKPHTHVRYVSGIMVPLTEDNYANRTDSEIVEKLKKMGKLA